MVTKMEWSSFFALIFPFKKMTWQLEYQNKELENIYNRRRNHEILIYTQYVGTNHQRIV